jgi:hypothetical protein
LLKPDPEPADWHYRLRVRQQFSKRRASDGSAQGNLQRQACGRRTGRCGGIGFGRGSSKWGGVGERHLRINQRGGQRQRLHEHRDQLRGRTGLGHDGDRSGLFDGAVANGLTNTTGQTTDAESYGNFSLAYAGGPNTSAQAGTNPATFPCGPGGGNLNLASRKEATWAHSLASTMLMATDVGNAAFNIANDPGTSLFTNVVFAGGNSGRGVVGVGNVAANLGGTSSATQGNAAEAFGQGNVATNLGGTGNIIEAGLFNKTSTTPSTLSTAFGLGAATTS